MRSSHLKRPTARIKRSGSRKRRVQERDEITNDSNQDLSAEQRVNDFLLKLTTPNLAKPTKKIKFASKAKKTVQTANEQILGSKTRGKENVKPKDKKDIIPPKVTAVPSATASMKRTRQRVRSGNASGSANGGGAAFKAPKPKTTANGVINSKLPKTSMARSNHNGNTAQSRSTRANHPKSKSNSNKSSLSPPSQSAQQQPVIDQYSLSLQIKNSECESLKNENKELKERNKALEDIEREHQFCKRDILNLHEASRTDKDRIAKLERKLESCGIDSIALKSPAFMNEDTQKHIVFWRERLFKARDKRNERKLKQKQMIQTAIHYIEQLSC